MRRLVALAIGALALAPVPAQAAGSPGFLGIAAADGVRVGVSIDHFVVVSNVVDAGGPAAQATVNAFGDSKAYAAYPYPGEVVLTAHGLSQGAAPDYPLIASSSSPTTPKASVEQGPYALHATSADETSSADASGTADGGVAGTRTRSVAAVKHDPASGTVVAESETTLEGLSFAGVLSLGRVHSHVLVTTKPGAKPVKKSDTEFADVTVAGQAVGLTDQGLVLPGTTVPLPSDSTANAALSAAGVTVHYLAGYSSGPTSVAPGVAVSVVQDVPGAGRTTVTYTLGQVSATARAGVASVSETVGGVVPPLGSADRPDLPLPPGQAPAEAASIPVAAPATATAPQQPVSAPVAAPQTVRAGLTTGPSSASLYAVVALGAVVMVGAAQLFRVLAVRLAWT